MQALLYVYGRMLGIEPPFPIRFKWISAYFLVDSRGENRVMCQPSAC